MTYTTFKNNRYKPIPTPFDTIKEHNILSKEEEIKFFELYYSVDDSSIKEELTQNIQLALSLLTEKERKVIDLRFGFSNNTNKKKQLSLSDIGKILNLTHEGVRVIEKRALSKLSNDKVFNLLKDYIP